MPRIRQVKTTFTAGEVSRSLLGRGDLRAYENGALTLRNVFIQPTGGVTRRAGLRYIDTAAGAGRLIEALFRIEATAALRLDVGRGMKDVALRQLGEDAILDVPPPLVSDDIRVRAFGWKNRSDAPLWKIEQSIPLPFTLLSVTTEVMVND